MKKKQFLSFKAQSQTSQKDEVSCLCKSRFLRIASLALKSLEEFLAKTDGLESGCRLKANSCAPFALWPLVKDFYKIIFCRLCVHRSDRAFVGHVRIISLC